MRQRRWRILQYRTSEIDVRQPLAPLQLAPDESGAGILVRRGNRPIGFLLKETEPGSLLTSEILEEWIVESLKLKIVEEALNEELSRTASEPQMPAVCHQTVDLTLAAIHSVLEPGRL
jgi:hypothetical protein